MKSISRQILSADLCWCFHVSYLSHIVTAFASLGQFGRLSAWVGLSRLLGRLQRAWCAVHTPQTQLTSHEKVALVSVLCPFSRFFFKLPRARKISWNVMKRRKQLIKRHGLLQVSTRRKIPHGMLVIDNLQCCPSWMDVFDSVKLVLNTLVAKCIYSNKIVSNKWRRPACFSLCRCCSYKVAYYAWRRYGGVRIVRMPLPVLCL